MPEIVDALAELDRVLADRPLKVGHDFSAATRCLVAWRDALTERWREAGAEQERRALERVNAALSVIVGGQYPLGQVPWPAIERVRHDLGALASEEAGQAVTPAGNSSQTTRS
ncbi:MAG TPA: hypothetical protein VFL55_11415 [Acetobacteraceae bacterium]|nr:hypothetical protein [Acetobacteraceae bacterium]